MSSDKRMVSFQADGDMADAIDRFKDNNEFQSQSDMHRFVYRVGLREQQNPIVWRLKDRVIEWINLLTISAVIVFIMGAATNVLAFAEGVAASVVMLLVATIFMAAFELTRTTLGMNAVGAKVRDVLGRQRL